MAQNGEFADTLLLTVADDAAPGESLAATLGIGHVRLGEHRFPDGESRVTLPPRLGRRVLVHCSLDRPNERLVPLLLALHGLREAGTPWIGLVVPYLAYMRQDAAFHPGEVISQRIIASLLADPIDALWTVDPHLHRVASLDEVFPRIRATALTAGPLLADWVRANAADAVLIGPDRESEQWVRGIASQCGSSWGVAEKTRLGDREVRICLPDVAVAGRRCVLIDDVASTARTLAGATEQLLQAGAAAVDVLVTHALFVGDAEDTLRASGAERLVSTNSIAHASNALDLAPLLATPIVEALRRVQP